MSHFLFMFIAAVIVIILSVFVGYGVLIEVPVFRVRLWSISILYVKPG